MVHGMGRREGMIIQVEAVNKFARKKKSPARDIEHAKFCIPL